MTDEGFRLPNISQRTAIIGRTGSGKTRLGWKLLSLAPFDQIPYVLVDYKREGLFTTVDRIREISSREVPKQPGLYIIRPHVGDEDEMEKWLWKLWDRESCGLYIDEGYMLPQNPRGAFTAILTQGRSKHIPVYCLTQRPSWISRFVFSEADYYAVMQLNDERDAKTVQAFIKRDKADVTRELPDYHAYWYDVAKRQAYVFKPVEDETIISERIAKRLAPKRKEI